MKHAVTKPFSYLYIAILTIVGFIPFLVQVVFFNFPSWGLSFAGYPYATWIIALVYGFAAFLWSDLYGANWRRKNNEWSNPFPEEVVNRIWDIRFPLYASAVNIIIVAAAFELTLRIGQWTAGIGYYPFLG